MSRVGPIKGRKEKRRAGLDLACPFLTNLGYLHSPAKAHAGDVAEDEATNARPVTPCPSPTTPRTEGRRFPGWLLLPLDPRCLGFHPGFIWILDGLDLTLIQSGSDQTVQTWSHRATAPR